MGVSIYWSCSADGEEPGFRVCEYLLEHTHTKKKKAAQMRLNPNVIFTAVFMLHCRSALLFSSFLNDKSIYG